MSKDTERKNQWQREHLDRVNFTMPKGHKETVQAHAAANGESTNAFIKRAIDTTMAQDAELASFEAQVPEFANKYRLTIEDPKEFSKVIHALSALEVQAPGITSYYCSRIRPQSKPQIEVDVIYTPRDTAVNTYHPLNTF